MVYHCWVFYFSRVYAVVSIIVAGKISPSSWSKRFDVSFNFSSPSARRRRRRRDINSNDRKNPTDLSLFNGPSKDQQRTISPSQISAKERLFSAKSKSPSPLINLNELKANDRQPSGRSVRMDSPNEKSALKDPATPANPVEIDIQTDRTKPDLDPTTTNPVELDMDRGKQIVEGKRSSSSAPIDQDNQVEDEEQRGRRASISSVSVKRVVRSRSSHNKNSSAKNVPHRFNHVTVRKIDRPKSSGDH